MKKTILVLLLLLLSTTSRLKAQDLSIDETLKYIASNSSTYFKVDSQGFIYNDRYRFHASEVSATEHMSSAVRIMCPSTTIPGAFGGYSTEPPKCITCLKRDCYEGTYGGQTSTNDMYINVDSTYDQRRLINALNHLFKKVAAKYPKPSNNDPFAR